MFEEVARHGAGLVAVAAIEGRLSAAGLVLREIHFVAEPFQHVGHGHADLGKQLIDHAGNEQRYPFAHAVPDCISFNPLQALREQNTPIPVFSGN